PTAAASPVTAASPTAAASPTDPVSPIDSASPTDPANPAAPASPATAHVSSPAPAASGSGSAAQGPSTGLLRVDDVRDYAIVFVNGKRQGVLDRMKKQDSLLISVPAGGATLDILVENMGRINFGPNLLKNKKGITQMVSFNDQELKGWKMYSFPFDHVAAQAPANAQRPASSHEPAGPSAAPRTTATATTAIATSATATSAAATSVTATSAAASTAARHIASSATTRPTAAPHSASAALEMPTLKRAKFHLDAIGDTYLDMRSWGKGCVWINGHNLGRYWEIGPQQTIYVPAEWLKRGDNVVEVLELLKPQQNELKSLQKPILAQLQSGTR
ncbi:MAG TPA: hypothetical protein VGS79_00770, partial [Puia sp.]|nr:hypothetical protein [Puia sp.]